MGSFASCCCFCFILADGMAAQLVIAHETGAIRSDLSGQSAEMVVDSRASSMGTPACKYFNIIRPHFCISFVLNHFLPVVEYELQSLQGSIQSILLRVTFIFYFLCQ